MPNPIYLKKGISDTLGVIHKIKYELPLYIGSLTTVWSSDM